MCVIEARVSRSKQVKSAKPSTYKRTRRQHPGPTPINRFSRSARQKSSDFSDDQKMLEILAVVDQNNNSLYGKDVLKAAGVTQYYLLERLLQEGFLTRNRGRLSGGAAWVYSVTQQGMQMLASAG